MYTAPLIAGTNRRPTCCMLALHWRTVTAIDHQLLILLRINNWCLNIYILMIYHNGISAEGDLTNEDEERLVTWFTLRKLNWSKRPFEYLVIESPFLWYRLQRSRYMKSDSKIRQLWLMVRKNIALNRVQREMPAVRRISFPSTVTEDRS